MRHLRLCLALVLCVSGTWAARGEAARYSRFDVRIDGPRVRIAGDRWIATLEGGAVTGVENRLTGEVFARPESGAPACLPGGLGVLGESVEEAARLHGPWGSADLKQGETDPKKDFPSQHRPYAKSVFAAARPDRLSVKLSYTGLAGGGKEYPDETFELVARLDPETGDLVLRSSGASAKGGVYGAAVAVANIDRTFKASVAHLGGMVFDAEWPAGQYSLGDGGPFLEGPVIAVESRRGSMGVWAQDRAFRPKNLFWQNTEKGFNIVWQTRNAAPMEPHTAARSAEWRLNCFRGSWVAALEPYRDWFRTAFKDDVARRPEWAKRIRVIIPELPMTEESMKEIAAVFDPATVLLHAWSARKPSFDTELPDFTPREDFIKSVETAHKLGFRTSAYVNTVCINKDAPKTDEYRLKEIVLFRGSPFSKPKTWDDYKPGSIIYTDPLSPGWRALHARLMKEFVERTKVDALYEDCAGTCGDFGNGPVDGLAPLQGTYEILRQTRNAVAPGTAFSSEYHVERTAPFVTWALHGTGWGGPGLLKKRTVRGRPVNAYIWGPDVFAWIHGSSIDLADAIGAIYPIGRIWMNSVRGGAGLAAHRAKLFAAAGLRPAFPETPWEDGVIAYYEDAKGGLYRLCDRSGHVMLDPRGNEVYRRTRGLASVASKLAIRGWPANGADGPVGLDPAWEYDLVPGSRDETAVRVSAISAGAFVAGYREGAGFTILSLGTPAGAKPPASVRLEYRLAQPVAQTLIDGNPVAPRASGSGWTLDVLPDSTVVFLSGAGVKPSADGWVGDMHDQGVIVPSSGPALVMEMARGKLHEAGFALPGTKTSLPAFLAATPGGVRLVFDHAVEVPGPDSVLRLHGFHVPQKYGNGQQAIVWINGKQVFATDLPREGGQIHQWDVPLGAYAGKTVLITIAGDPKGDSNCDNMRLTRPRIVADPSIKAPAHRIL